MKTQVITFHSAIDGNSKKFSDYLNKMNILFVAPKKDVSTAKFNKRRREIAEWNSEVHYIKTTRIDVSFIGDDVLTPEFLGKNTTKKRLSETWEGVFMVGLPYLSNSYHSKVAFDATRSEKINVKVRIFGEPDNGGIDVFFEVKGTDLAKKSYYLRLLDAAGLWAPEEREWLIANRPPEVVAEVKADAEREAYWFETKDSYPRSSEPTRF